MLDGSLLQRAMAAPIATALARFALPSTPFLTSRKELQQKLYPFFPAEWIQHFILLFSALPLRTLYVRHPMDTAA